MKTFLIFFQKIFCFVLHTELRTVFLELVFADAVKRSQVSFLPMWIPSCLSTFCCKDCPFFSALLWPHINQVTVYVWVCFWTSLVR